MVNKYSQGYKELKELSEIKKNIKWILLIDAGAIILLVVFLCWVGYELSLIQRGII